MLKLIKLTAIFLLLASISFAQSPFLTLMADNGIAYEAETLAYQLRVETDGGEIINIDLLNSAIIDAKTNNYLDSLGLWVCPQFGVKKDANNKVTKLYDITENDNDLIQADTSKCATLTGDSLYFNGENRFYEFTDISTIREAFWVISYIDPANTNFRFLLGDNSTYDFHSGADAVYYDAGFSSTNIRAGITRNNKNYIANPTTSKIKRIKQLISLETTGNVEAGNYTQDRGDGSRCWYGSMWELMISSKVLGTTIKSSIEDELNNRHSVFTLTLGAEMITNGNMEIDDSWTSFGFEGSETNDQSTTQYYSASNSRHIVVDGASEGVYSDDITIETGKTYRVSFYIYGISGNVIAQNYTGAFTGSLTITPPTGVWTEYNFNISGASDGTDKILIMSSGGAAEFYLDDISVKELIE